MKKVLPAVLLFTIFNAATAWPYLIYLKNGRTFDALEHTETEAHLKIKIKTGVEIGILREDVDWDRTKASLRVHEDKLKKEALELQRKKALEAKEKKTDDLSAFAFEKRGMQMSFTDDEISSLIDTGEKHASEMDLLLAPYTFNNEYLPSVLYTKRLRLILYGTEKVRGKKQFVPTEIRSIVEDPNLLMLLVLGGDEPEWYSEAELFIEQSGRKINPFNYKYLIRGERTTKWPDSPAYYWKILLNFGYNELDLKKQATLVLKKDGISREFVLDFPSFR